MRLGVTLLGVNKVGKLGGVANEEDRCIVEDPVEIAFVGAYLDGKAARITGRVRRARLTADGGETDSSTGPVANLFKKRSTSEVGDVMRHFEVAVRASTLRMDLSE
jgi:hypothetical protein